MSKKVKCIRTDFNMKDFSEYVTKGNEYDVIETKEYTYIIKDDKGFESELYKGLFKKDTRMHFKDIESKHIGIYIDDDKKALESDVVNHPLHYNQGKFECIEVIEEITKPCEKFEAYLIGTILKYLWRWKYKNGLEDLKKARWYLDRLISNVEDGGVK